MTGRITPDNVLRIYFVAKNPAGNEEFGDKIKPDCYTSAFKTGSEIKIKI